MRNLLNIIAVLLIIGWLTGTFAYSLGGLIHALVIVAVVLILINLLNGRKLI